MIQITIEQFGLSEAQLISLESQGFGLCMGKVLQKEVEIYYMG